MCLLSRSVKIIVFFLSLVSGLSLNAQTKHRNPPNIIFLLTDDQRWDALGVMGNTIIRTPNMDKLATLGIIFENAYVTTSICCVSRASIFTGQYESRHQINDFSTGFTAGALAKTYPVLLKEAGYSIGFIGKFGVGKQPPDSIFNFFINTEGGGKTQPDYIVTDKKGHKIHDTDTIDHAIAKFLDEYGRHDEPFCLSVSFKAPHIQDGNPGRYIIQERYAGLYKEVTIPQSVTAKPEYWNRFPAFFRTDKNIARQRWIPMYSTPELFQKNAKNYYRLITGVDDVIGNMMDQLEKLGIDSNTVIIFMGDNGFMMGDHNMQGKWYGYEGSIRVPLFIYDMRLPDKIRKIRSRQIALNIDIAPTILSLAGIPVPDSMQGVDLISLLEGKVSDRTDFFYQHYFWGSPKIPREEGVVTRRFKYMKYIEHNYEELYDIKYDPHETTNLAGDSSYELKLQRLRDRYKVLKALAR